MISNIQKDLLSTILLALALIVAIGTLIYAFLIPAPSLQGALNGRVQQSAKLKKEAKNATIQAQNLRTSTEVHVWQEGPATMAPKALSQVGAVAAKNHVKLTGFRPQKEIVLGSLIESPFFVTVEGSFSNVATFTHEVEYHEAKLAASVIQLSSSDQSTDRVNASLTLVAYRSPDLIVGVRSDAPKTVK